MAKNKQLGSAKTAKKDEFYTRLEEIENELRFYKHHFKNKTVLCNCDDPRISNFFHYFSYNFESLGLKRLMTICYKNQQRDLFSQNDSERAIWLEYTGDRNGDRIPNPEEIGINHLEDNGDFRNTESIELLKQADIVVTNPPFSLFREYVAQLIEYKKKFLIIGNMNALTYKEIFPLVKDNKLWLGASIHSGDRMFYVPDYYPLEAAGCGVDENGRRFIRVKGVRWFTNLDHKQRHEKLDLYKKYNPEEFPTYDNYDAIDVSKTADIPLDYAGMMGVPITFMDKYNPEQFEIVGCADYTGLYGADDIGIKRIGEEWIRKYRKQGGKGHYTANMNSLVYYDNEGRACNTFKRILIRNRNPEKPKKGAKK